MSLFNKNKDKEFIAELKYDLANERNKKGDLETELNKAKKELSEITKKLENRDKSIERYKNEVQETKETLTKEITNLTATIKNKDTEIVDLKEAKLLSNQKAVDFELELNKTKDTLTKVENEAKANVFTMDMFISTVMKADLNTSFYADSLKTFFDKTIWVAALLKEPTKAESKQYKKDIGYVKNNPVLPFKEGLDPNHSLKCNNFEYVKVNVRDKFFENPEYLQNSVKRFYDSKVFFKSLRQVKNFNNIFTNRRYNYKAVEKMQDTLLISAFLWDIGTVLAPETEKQVVSVKDYAIGIITQILPGFTEIKEDLINSFANYTVYEIDRTQLVIKETETNKLKPQGRKNPYSKKAPIPIVEPISLTEIVIGLLYKGYAISEICDVANNLLKPKFDTIHYFEHKSDKYPLEIKQF